MAINGSSVNEEISEKIREVENQSESLERKIYGYEKNITALGQEREDIYFTLATTYLPDLESRSIKQTLSEVQADVKKIFAQKQERREVLDNKIGRMQKDKKAAEDELKRVTDNLNAKGKEKEETQEKIGKELQSTDSYVQLDKQARQAQERVTQNMARVQDVKAMAQREIPVYESNRMFSYLLRRGFGTDQYNKTGLTARLDSWVAEIVRFNEQKPKYDFLVSMPELMKRELEKRQKDLDKIVAEMQKAERQLSEKYGLPKVLGEGEKLLKERTEILGKITAFKGEYQSYTDERAQLDGTKDPYHIQAVQKLKGFLKGENISNLRKRAKETPGKEDDTLVNRLEEIDGEVRTAKDYIIRVKSQRDAIAKKLNGLNKIQDHFSSNSYDGRRSYFDDGLDINSLLVGYIAGTISSDRVTSTMDDNHHVRSEPTYSHSSSYSSRSYDDDDDSSSSSSYSSSSSSSFDSSSFSSGGGFGGGGSFSSGGGF